MAFTRARDLSTLKAILQQSRLLSSRNHHRADEDDLGFEGLNEEVLLSFCGEHQLPKC